MAFKRKFLVFTNLLSNAIKYSPTASKVDVTVEAFPETVCISVRDQGIGILPEQREKIFERFYRVAVPEQKGISGLGMGLYIVAEISSNMEERSQWTVKRIEVPLFVLYSPGVLCPNGRGEPHWYPRALAAFEGLYSQRAEPFSQDYQIYGVLWL